MLYAVRVTFFENQEAEQALKDAGHRLSNIEFNILSLNEAPATGDPVSFGISKGSGVDAPVFVHGTVKQVAKEYSSQRYGDKMDALTLVCDVGIGSITAGKHYIWKKEDRGVSDIL